MRYEPLDPKVLFEYERFFFREICLLETGDRDAFSIELPEIPNMHFACVQDTVERLTKISGRLSAFQWRNCLFAPIDERTKLSEVYQEAFAELRHAYPSLFIRSYVYVIFIKVPSGDHQLFKTDQARTPSKNDFQIYQQNTQYDIKRQGKTDLFNIMGSKTKLIPSNETSRQADSDKVFIVSNPRAELTRILDANSDVIDAVKSYMGSLALVSQTEECLDKVCKAFEADPSARVLLQGPARSGKTVVAMSLLPKVPNSKMLLMNWYFYDALKDAFRVWSGLSQAEIRKMFETDETIVAEVQEKRQQQKELMRYKSEPKLLDCEIRMRELRREGFGCLPRVKPYGSNDWRISNNEGYRVGDYAIVYSGRAEKLELRKVTRLFPESGTAAIDFAYRKQEAPRHERLLRNDEQNQEALRCLRYYENLIDRSLIDDYLARLMREIAEALGRSEQRFFHHDRKEKSGCWIDGDNKPYIGDEGPLIIDEAQRLGFYCGVDELALVADRRSGMLLCGDDFQMLNRKGDAGIRNVVKEAGRSFLEFEFPDSVGIPKEICQLVKSMLGEGGECQFAGACPYQIRLIYRNDQQLVEEFHADSSTKKHFALPTSTGFYDSDYVPGIWRTHSATSRCDENCDEYCIHKFIPMLSPRADPRRRGSENEKDLSRQYKYFCSEAIMPNYVLDAYELISREVESLYLKIPERIDSSICSVSLSDSGRIESWIKRHLYVLMTRPTARLVINVENRGLYERFDFVCKRLGVSSVD